MNLQKNVTLIVCIFMWFSMTGQLCTKKIVYGKDYYTTPYVVYFRASRQQVFDATQKNLELLGYELNQVDMFNGKLSTGWKPVSADSHYFDYFGRKDFGFSDGAYFQLVVHITDSGNDIKVSVSTLIKSISGPLKSSLKLEKQLVQKLKNNLRSTQIEMTNVGVEDK